MIVDTSALFAILAEEPEAPKFRRAIVEAQRPRISAATLVEARVVVEARLGPRQRRRLDALLRERHAEVVPFDEEQATIASDADRDSGRGAGQPAPPHHRDRYAARLAP